MNLKFNNTQVKNGRKGLTTVHVKLLHVTLAEWTKIIKPVDAISTYINVKNKMWHTKSTRSTNTDTS